LVHFSPLNITAFYDTRSGHAKQTRGLIHALSELTSVQLHEVFLPEYDLTLILKDWIKLLTGVPGKGAPAPHAPELILGTGTHTHIPMLLHRRRYRGKVVTCMTPEWPLLKLMDLCLIPAHDRPAKAAHIVSTVGPPNTAFDRDQHDPEKGLIVLGGIDSRTHCWDNENIMMQVCRIIDAQPAIFWTLATSPRTPRDMCRMLAGLAENRPQVRFVPFEDSQPGWIENQYDQADGVWVSADSVSMIYEALTAGCRVGVLSVAWKKKGDRLARAVDLLEKSNRVISFESFMQHRTYPGRSELNEAQRCAREMLRRWWPDRLP
jgi:uncharacterized protein